MKLLLVLLLLATTTSWGQNTTVGHFTGPNLTSPQGPEQCIGYFGPSVKKGAKDTLPFNDSFSVRTGVAEYGWGYVDSTGRELAAKWNKRGWEIKDTMGLIRELERRMEESQDRATKFEEMHYAAKEVILHLAYPMDKKKYDAFIRYWEAYIKVLRKYRNR